MDIDKVKQQFPQYFSTLQYGIECESGWYPIICDLFTRFNALENQGASITVLQVKEKCGALLVHLNSDVNEAEALAAEARRNSAKVCEICGVPGDLHGGRGTVKTLCRHHGKELNLPWLSGLTALDMGESIIARLPDLQGSGETPRIRPRLVFLDTEFTDIEFPSLISIGLVSETGETFYAELTDGWKRTHCSQMVLDEVLPVCQGGTYTMDRKTAGNRLSWWIKGQILPVRIVTDAPDFDWDLMMKLIAGRIPDNLMHTPLPFYSLSFPEMEDILRDARRQALTGKSVHHALNDAEALKSAWQVMENSFLPEMLERYLWE